MNILLWALLPLVLLIVLGFSLSFYITQRAFLGQVYTPADYGLDYEEVAFPAADGESLHGVWIPAAGAERTVVILHGHGGSMDLDICRAPHFHRAGYNVFLFDFRAHGRSAGKLATFGYLERQDVLGVLAHLATRQQTRIGLIGFSYGGMASMLAAPLAPRVRAVISDGGPARLRSGIAGEAVQKGLPRWLGTFLGWLTIVCTSLRLGVNLFRYEPIRWVGKIAPRPIFFIHGEADLYLPDFTELVAAAGEPKEVWTLPGVAHCQASEAEPEAYYRRVLAFFDKYLYLLNK